MTDRTYTQTEVSQAVQAALRDERRLIAEGREAMKRLAELESAEGNPEAATTNHEANVAAAESMDLDLAALIQSTAAGAGAKDAAVVAGLVDREQVTYDDAGMPQNLDGLVADVLAQHPYLRSDLPPIAGADQGARAGRTTSEQDAIRLLETNPRRFDELVARGVIPRDIFGGH